MNQSKFPSKISKKNRLKFKRTNAKDIISNKYEFEAAIIAKILSMRRMLTDLHNPKLDERRRSDHKDAEENGKDDAHPVHRIKRRLARQFKNQPTITFLLMQGHARAGDLQSLIEFKQQVH
ncbi:hypothetical protein RF11_01037 [Thelohanellus kitauei]|uniref:Uncharacterized protein n=1 Tax=Thelohanellus kitauei TaxID=669202 RepID=A0A0C2M6K0_THEKT|nr:hypothetical protein RF11_01037 [Thelohanellus kitauei]